MLDLVLGDVNNRIGSVPIETVCKHQNSQMKVGKIIRVASAAQELGH